MIKKPKKILLIAILAAACIALAVTNYLHYFTARKWAEQPENRYQLIDSLEFQYPVYALPQKEIVQLLGEPDGQFSGGIYYELGVPSTWMDFLHPIEKNSRVSDSCLQYYIYFNDQGIATRTRMSTQG